MKKGNRGFISKNWLFIIAIPFFVILIGGIYVLGLVQGYKVGVNNLKTPPTPTPLIEVGPEKIVIVTPTGSPRPTKPPSWGGPDLWAAVNKRRTQLGVNPLQTRDDLCTIASIRLNELLRLGRLDDHIGFTNMPTERPDLKPIFDSYSAISEFLAQGGQSADETVGLWENTLGHSELLKGGQYVWGCIYAQNTFAVAIAAY